MSRSASRRRRPSVRITLERAARLHRLVGFLAGTPRNRLAILSELRIGLRTFYRELELLKRCGVKVRQRSKLYFLWATAEQAEGRLPSPDPQLSFAEVAELAQYDCAAGRRLAALLAEVIEWHEPRALAFEDVYFGRNVRSAMAVGQASGMAMLAAAQRGVGCFSYTPQAIKMAVCGSGSAGKRQVQRMVGTLLGLPETPFSEHAADALAVAICHGGAAVGRRQAIEAPLGPTRGPAA